jgi:hypothetical protein
VRKAQNQIIGYSNTSGGRVTYPAKCNKRYVMRKMNEATSISSSSLMALIVMLILENMG